MKFRVTAGSTGIPGPVVVDTTISMQPYIERTREAIARVVRRIGDTAVRDNFRFGMVVFRDSIEGRPALEYTSRLVAAPDFTEAPDALLEALVPFLQEHRP